MFGCISKNFPENIFWCLEKKKENTNLEKHKPQPRKKTSTIAIQDRNLAGEIAINVVISRSRSTLREIAPSIAISIRRDLAFDRDLDPARCREGEIAPSRDRDVDRDLAFARSRRIEIAIDGAISRSRLREIAIVFSGFVFSGFVFSGL